MEFQGAPEDAQNWFVGSADIKNAFHQMLLPGWLQASFAFLAVLASRVGNMGKTIMQKRLGPDSLLYLVNTSIALLGRCFFVKMSRTTARSREVLIILSLFVVTTLHHRCSVANMAWDPVASDGLFCADNFGVLARGENCTNIHLARLIAGVQKASLDVHDTSPASGSADVSGYEVSPANAYCSGTGKRKARVRSVARTVSSRRRIGVFLGAQQSWCSLNS